MTPYLRHAAPIESLHLEGDGVARFKLTVGDPQRSNIPLCPLRALPVLQCNEQLCLLGLDSQVRQERMADNRGFPCGRNPSDQRSAIRGRGPRGRQRASECLVQEVWNLRRHLSEGHQGDVSGGAARGLHRPSIAPDRERPVAIHASREICQQSFIIHESYGTWESA